MTSNAFTIVLVAKERQERAARAKAEKLAQQAARQLEVSVSWLIFGVDVVATFSSFSQASQFACTRTSTLVLPRQVDQREKEAEIANARAEAQAKLFVGWLEMIPLHGTPSQLLAIDCDALRTERRSKWKRKRVLSA